MLETRSPRLHPDLSEQNLQGRVVVVGEQIRVSNPPRGSGNLRESCILPPAGWLRSQAEDLRTRGLRSHLWGDLVWGKSPT